MGKLRVFSGVAVIGILANGWNHFYHPRVTNTMFWTAVAVWYAICCLNFIDGRYRRPVLFFGKYLKTLGPGFSLLDPLLFTTLKDICVQEDTEKFEVEFLTRDGVSVSFTGLLTYGIDPNRIDAAVMGIYDVFGSLRERTRSTIADAAMFTELDVLLGDRDEFCAAIRDELSERVDPWGVWIKAFESESVKVNDPAIADAIASRARAKFDLEIADMFNKTGQAYTPDGRWYKTIESARSGQHNMFLIPTTAPAAQAPRAQASTPAPRVEAAPPPPPKATNGSRPAQAAQVVRPEPVAARPTTDQLRFAPQAPRATDGAAASSFLAPQAQSVTPTPRFSPGSLGDRLSRSPARNST